MVMYPLFFAVLVQTSSPPQARETIKVSPPIIMPQELITVTDKIMLPPVPVTYK